MKMIMMIKLMILMTVALWGWLWGCWWCDEDYLACFSMGLCVVSAQRLPFVRSQENLTGACWASAPRVAGASLSLRVTLRNSIQSSWQTGGRSEWMSSSRGRSHTKQSTNSHRRMADWCFCYNKLTLVSDNQRQQQFITEEYEEASGIMIDQGCTIMTKMTIWIKVWHHDHDVETWLFPLGNKISLLYWSYIRKAFHILN